MEVWIIVFNLTPCDVAMDEVAPTSTRSGRDLRLLFKVEFWPSAHVEDLVAHGAVGVKASCVVGRR